MRSELLPPAVDDVTVQRLVTIAEDIRECLDCGDDPAKLLAEFNDAVPIMHEAEDFFAVDSAMDAETFVRRAFAFPPEHIQVSDEELIELISRVRGGAHDEVHGAYWLRLVASSVAPQPDVAGVIGHAGSPEEALQKLRTYKPIQLGS